MDKKLLEKILASGNKLVFEARDILVDLGWEVQMGVYYNDDITNKPREIDIFAEKDFPHFKDSPEPKLKVILSIECKYIDKDFALWTESNNLAEARKSIVASGINIDEMVRYGDLEKKHHYFDKATPIAKLYDSIERDGGTSIIFDAITQPIKALIYKKSGYNESENILYYPLAVYSGKADIYEINELADLRHLNKLPKGNKYQVLSCNYSYRNSSGKNETRQFYIDLIKKDELKKFIETLEKEEIELTRQYLTSRYQDVKTSY